MKRIPFLTGCEMEPTIYDPFSPREDGLPTWPRRWIVYVVRFFYRRELRRQYPKAWAKK